MGDYRFCIECGHDLDPAHRFCSRCGSPRWRAEDGDGGPAAPERPAAPPAAGTAPFAIAPSPVRADVRVRAPGLPGPIPWLYAAVGVYLLVLADQLLALYLSPVWREQQLRVLAGQGYQANVAPAVLALSGALLIAGCLAGAAAHGLAFHGLRRLRRWGWLAAVVTAALWSLLLVGIPVLIWLTSARIRRAFGIA